MLLEIIINFSDRLIVTVLIFKTLFQIATRARPRKRRRSMKRNSRRSARPTASSPTLKSDLVTTTAATSTTSKAVEVTEGSAATLTRIKSSKPSLAEVEVITTAEVTIRLEDSVAAPVRVRCPEDFHSNSAKNANRCLRDEKTRKLNRSFQFVEES